MKKKLVLGLLTACTLASMPLNVMAKGTAVVNFTSTDKVEVGNTFKVYMNVENIKDTYDGVISFGGRLTFDENKVEYISAKNLDTPYEFEINPASMMLAGLDFTLKNGIYDNTSIYEFTFKAKETGNTTITLNEAKLTDSKDYIDRSVIGKTIEIVEPVKEEKAEVQTNIKVEDTVKTTEVKLNKNIENIVKVEDKKSEIVPKVESNKEKLVKMNNYVHDLLKKLSNLIK